MAGIARSSFYEIKKAYEQFGREGLVPRPKRRPRMPNEYPQEIVDKILAMTRQFPAYSYVRIAGQLQIEGVSVSASGVRKVWERNGLVKKLSRYLWLEREVSAGAVYATLDRLELAENTIVIFNSDNGGNVHSNVPDTAKTAKAEKAKGAGAKAKVVGVNFHDSRAEAIWRLSKKLDVMELARVVGHRNIGSLLLYYQATADELADKLG